MSGIAISCLIDDDPKFLRQGELWLRSLNALGTPARAKICVHYVDAISPSRLTSLQRLGAILVPVKRYSEGRTAYCNKLRQLETPALAAADYVILSDADIAFAQCPTRLATGDAVAAKLVDEANPPEQVWRALFEIAQVAPPELAEVELQPGAYTFATNCNGGLYVIPRAHFATLRTLWPKWVSFCFAQAELLGPRIKHTDQLAFGLSLCAAEIPLRALPIWENFPLHRSQRLEETLRGKVAAFHYHDMLGADGLIESTSVGWVDEQVAALNATLAPRSRASSRKRLLLHVGMPKTGTSALQRWCETHRSALRAQGVDYPETDPQLIDPKHQFLVPSLKSGNFERLNATLDASHSAALLLSMEGMTNHLYDFSEAALQGFRDAVRDYRVEVFMVVRDAEAWLRSFYKQAVINPPIAAYSYATPLTLNEFRQLPRVQRLMNIEQLKAYAAKAYGADALHLAQYESDWMGAFVSALGVDGDARNAALSQENTSLTDDLVELIRQINAQGLDSEERAFVLAALSRSFETNHRVLNAYRAVIQRAPAAGARSIWQKLVAKNEAQERMIEALIAGA
ncbi:MAG: hypothetical protein QM759_15115 [Terricaulis sp.]